jgi:hypothetical protein
LEKIASSFGGKSVGDYWKKLNFMNPEEIWMRQMILAEEHGNSKLDEIELQEA